MYVLNLCSAIHVSKAFMLNRSRTTCLYHPLSGLSVSSAIDLARMILRSSLVGKCTAAPGEDLALLVVENQSVLVGFSQAFEQQFQQHAASTRALALRCKPLDSCAAYTHIVQAVVSYRQGLYQDSPAGYPSAPVLYLLSPLRFQTNYAIGLP